MLHEVSKHLFKDSLDYSSIRLKKKRPSLYVFYENNDCAGERKHPPLLLVQMLVPSEAINQPFGGLPSALQFSSVRT